MSVWIMMSIYFFMRSFCHLLFRFDSFWMVGKMSKYHCHFAQGFNEWKMVRWSLPKKNPSCVRCAYQYYYRHLGQVSAILLPFNTISSIFALVKNSLTTNFRNGKNVYPFSVRSPSIFLCRLCVCANVFEIIFRTKCFDLFAAQYLYLLDKHNMV